MNSHTGERMLFLPLYLWYVLVLPSCCPAASSPTLVSRVVFAYMGGDNNLSYEVEQKVAALKAGFQVSASGTERLLIFCATNGNEPRLIEVALSAQGGVSSHLVKTYYGHDSADGETLATVVADVRSRHPNARYGLILFSHGSGWLPQGMFLNPLLPEAAGRSRSIIRDEDNEMEIVELAEALPSGVFDYIVFEACFMAGVETAYCLRHKAPYIVASSAEIVSPGYTPVYPTAFRYLLTADVVGFAKAAFASVNSCSGWRRSATCSVIRTAALDDLRRFVAENADFNVPVDLFDVQHFDRNVYRLFFDLEDYYGRLLHEPQQREALRSLIRQSVVWRASTPEFMTGHGGFAVEHHCGLTTYIPQSEFIRLNQYYDRLEWTIGLR